MRMRYVVGLLLLSFGIAQAGNQYAALVWAPHEWYRYQGTADPGQSEPFDSSPNQESNCGCACVAMCIQYATGKWVPMDKAGGEPNVRFIMTGRNENEGTDWPNVEKGLERWNIPYRWVYKTDGIKEALSRRHPVMAMVQCSALPKAKSRNARVGRYYDFEWGHLLMVRGVTGDGRYFVCYDPQVFADKPDHWTQSGAPRGKDVLYKVSDFEAACAVKGGERFKALEICVTYGE